MKLSHKNEKNTAAVQEMTTIPVGRLILRLAIPTIVSMMVTSLYNMADTFFVSQLGTSASGAVGIIFSIMAIIQAIGFTIGMGSGSLLSRSLGAQNKKQADEFGSSAFFLSLLFGTILAVTGLIFQDSLIVKLGATPTILPYARDYARYILLGCPFMCTAFVLNNNLRFQGKAALSMIGLTTGGILNILLDPLFIFVFHWGISGAAIATLISQCVSFFILLSFFISGKTVTTLSPARCARSIPVYLNIIKNGLPSLFRQGTAAIAAVLLNIAAGAYGDAVVAGMSITNRIFMFLLAIALGIGQGFQPVCAMNYGAGRFDRVRQAFSFTVRLSAVIMSASAVICFIFAPEIIRAFRNDAEVISVGILAIRLQCCALPLHAFLFGSNMMLQTTGQSRQATFLSSLRQGLFFLPLIIILPRIIGITGIQVTQMTSDILSFIVTVPITMRFFKKIQQEPPHSIGAADILLE
jgi:putative MATE family efflux protein